MSGAIARKLLLKSFKIYCISIDLEQLPQRWASFQIIVAMSAMRRCTCFIICLLTSYTYGTTELVEYTRGDIEFDSSNGEKIIDISTTKGIRW